MEQFLNRRVENLLEDNIKKKVFTGASCAYKGRGERPEYLCEGTLAETKEMVTENTLFDLASCTKIIVTLAFMRLLEEGKIALTDTVERYLPSWKNCHTGKITMFELLTHTSMLPSHLPLYMMSKDKAGAEGVIKHLLPRASKGVEYSCLGYIVLGWVLEKVTGMTLDHVIENYVTKPLGMENTVYRPLDKKYRNIMPTEHCNWRKRLLIGEVHDENAFHLGGISGNAGLFSDIIDMCKLAEMMLTGEGADGTGFLKKETIAMMTKCYTKGLGENRGLGWRLKNTPDSTVGEYFSDTSFGHTGYTGTSIWIDKKYDFYAILLTNRVYYSRDSEDINHVRQVFHNITLLEYL